ncbi:MAG TPA: PGF-pre-PGF domain-containing protein [Methanocorpusculum sp.]|jgi:hypothetical protein|nr:PGF-pre-PGF domain-containing protein [Methanocorpusculum sp.]
MKNPDSIKACTGNVVKFLKISAVSILLFAVFCMAPAEALPADSYEDAKSSHQDVYLGANYDKRVLLDIFSDNTAAVVSSVRETKSRSSKKNQLLATDSASYADNSGNVFFSGSPVVTGMHLPKGVKGSVSLMNEPESAGPRCREVYNVFNIFVENYPQGLESTISYTLSLSEIENRGYSPADICLYFRDAESWMKLPTEYYMDGQYAFFESVTTSAGLFAIVSDDCEREVEPVTPGLKSPEMPGITLEVTPVSVLTHPMSYTTLAG